MRYCILTKAQFYIKHDDFLISKRQIVHGACGIVPISLDKAIVSNEYSVLRVTNGLLLKYLDYFSHTDYFQMTCFQSSVGVDVEKMIFDLKGWLKFKIHLPPIDEQRKIVEIISTWDDAIARTEQLIAALQRRKQGLMQRLLTGDVRFSEYNSDHWETVNFSEILNMTIGRTPARDNPDYWDSSKTTENIWLSISDLKQKHINNSKEYLSDLGVEVSRARLLPVDTVLISFKLTIGKTGILAKPAYTNEAICALTPKDSSRLSNRYLYYALSNVNFDKEVDQAVKGQTLNLSKLARLEISLPSLDEQNKIADIFDIVDNEIDLHIKKLAALKQQKKGLMQRLLTGQVRVRV